MSVLIRVPGSLKKWFQGQDEALCHGNTMGDCIEHLEECFPGFKTHLVDENGDISKVIIFLNGDNIRNLKGLATEVKDGDEISIIPLAAGG